MNFLHQGAKAGYADEDGPFQWEMPLNNRRVFVILATTTALAALPLRAASQRLLMSTETDHPRREKRLLANITDFMRVIDYLR